MKAMILAAGYAVRLQPLTTDTPKPLLTIGKKKMIDHILDKIASIRGLEAIYIITNNKFYKHFEEWVLGSEYEGMISLINDGTESNETRLGAVKDLELAVKEKDIRDDLLVVAGDNLFNFRLDAFLKFALVKSDGISVALYDIKDHKAARRFGVVEIDKDNRIVEFEEKPESPKSTLISTGIYYFPKEKLSSITKYINSESKKSDAPGYYINWMSQHDKVYGLPFTEKWYDVGDIESYRRANEDYSKKERNR